MQVRDLLNDVLTGSIVLPDFQRSFIWEPDAVREIVVSLLGDYFIGSMLVLEDFRDESKFALRLVEGVEQLNPSAKVQSIIKMLLDGQQRATALLYAVEEPNIPLKNRKNPYKFFIDFEKALNGDWDGSILMCNSIDKKKLNECKSRQYVVPLSTIKDISIVASKFKDDTRLGDIVKIANDFMTRKIYVVSLPRTTPLPKVVETFERINRWFEPLSIYELLTARLYKGNIKLVDMWKNAKDSHVFTQYLEPESVLRVIALLRGKETKRKDLIELNPKDFKVDWTRACKALDTALKRMTDLKKGYGVLDFNKWTPYSTMTVPLAALSDYVATKKTDIKDAYDKMDCWYWTSVLSARYDEGSISKQSSDYIGVKDWIENDHVPDFIKEFTPKNIDLSVDKQNSAIYKGVMAMIALEGALDFMTGQPPQFSIEKVQDDHIFPKSLYNDHRISNRTLISTNSEKGSKKPSVFFAEMKKRHGEETLKKILQSHLIPGSALNYLLANNLKAFTESRKQTIVKSAKTKTEKGKK